MKIAIIDTTKLFGSRSINKDLNGGFGTRDSFSDSIGGKIFERLRARAVYLPYLTSVYVYSILKQKGITVSYYHKNLPKSSYDIFLIVGSIVDYENENLLAGQLMKNYKNSKVGFIGPFPSTMPTLFPNADFIIDGEADAFFLYEFEKINTLDGIIKVENLINMDDLPSPDYSIFPYNSFKYKPILNQSPLLSIQASRGCPYSCGYYCTYPTSQGKKVRSRSPEALVDDILFLKHNFGMKSLLFRDPIFGINKEFPYLLSEIIQTKDITFNWGIETRADLLNKKNLKEMYSAGLRSINIGIETNDPDIAKKNKRKLSELDHQNKIINYCNQLGIKVIGFFIIGLEGDSIQSVKNMIEFAINQNIFVARFSVSTPYPGTKFYDQLNKENALLNKNFNNYNQFNYVIKNKNLNKKDVEELVSYSYKKYYLRWEKIYALLSDQIKSIWN